MVKRLFVFMMIICIIMTSTVTFAASVTSRQNPAKLNEKQVVTRKDYKGNLEYKIEITMTDLISGQSALDILLDKDEFLITGKSKSGSINQRKWTDNEEFILAKFKIKVIQTKDNKEKLFTTVSFNHVGKDNVFYDRVYNVNYPRNFETFLFKDIYPNGEVEGWMIFKVNKNDDKVVAVFDNGWTSETWFNLRSNINPVSSNLQNPQAPVINNEIKVLLNGQQLLFDQQPVIENGRTLVPLRAIFESLGAKVEWDNLTQTAICLKDDISIRIQIGNSVASVNGNPVTLDVPARNINGHTLVPLRFIGESLGGEVNWNNGTRTITINAKKEVPSNDSANKWGFEIYNQNSNADKIKLVKKYLTDNYSSLDTPLGTYDFNINFTNNFQDREKVEDKIRKGKVTAEDLKFVIHDNKFELQFKGDSITDLNFQLENHLGKYTDTAIQTTMDLLEKHMGDAINYINTQFDNPTVYGEYFHSWYKYKYIEQDWTYMRGFECKSDNGKINFITKEFITTRTNY